jgi:hypothetical protein
VSYRPTFAVLGRLALCSAPVAGLAAPATLCGKTPTPGRVSLHRVFPNSAREKRTNVVRKATAQDVADRVGVSRSAVSLVLNGRAQGHIARDKQQRSLTRLAS